MSHADFIHLRVHSAYSLSEGAITVKNLIKLCQGERMPAVGVCDSGNLFGALEFAMAAKESGIQPIIGCQMALRLEESEEGAARRTEAASLVLLVQDETGYRNLLKLVSRSFLESEAGEAPHLPIGWLEGHSEGLIALTGGPQGCLGSLIAAGQRPAAEGLLDRLQGLFPGRLYIELSRFGGEGEVTIEEALLDLAYARDLPLVATNDAFFPEAKDHEAHDALICIAQGKTVADPDRRRLTPEHRFKSAAEMTVLFADLPEAILNSLVIARRCSFFPDKRDPILPDFDTAGGRNEAEELRAQAETGLEQRIEAEVCRGDMDAAAREAAAKPYRDRLDYELNMIVQMGFPGYFLIVADFIQWAKAQGIPVGPGRGSGAGSVVAWALTITDLDPLRWGLLFERFLNPERVSMPDFDIDFCQDRRDEVIAYVQQRYGRDKVAQIITFGKLQARAALRDVGRVLQMPYPQVDRICKLVPNNPANPVTLKQAIEGEPQLQEMRREDPSVARLLETALGIEGLYRHASTHAAGVVIGDRPLDELVPLYRDPRSDMPATQFNMKYAELAGLVKFDFLGLKTLTVLDLACRLVERSGETVDLSQIPLDDPITFEMLSRADTVGVFQLESSGMRDALRRLKPDRFEDIIAVVALYRPGPMDNIPSYIKRKHGEEPVDCLHPKLESILQETYGVMIYQEQVMQIAQVLSGYTLGGADLLRRAMGKKIQAEMDAQRQNFVDGAVAREVDKTTASNIFDQVAKFAGYGFNKSHAAAYALVAYQTAYMKARYPVEFLAASMTYDMGNTDKLNLFRQELQRLDIPLLGPDINHSERDFAVEALPEGGKGIRYALGAVKNVGAAAMDGLVAERRANGRFKSLADLTGRIDCRMINKRQIENLARGGAFECLHRNRAQLYEAAEVIVRHAAAAVQERESAQNSLFGEAAAGPVEIPLGSREDWPEMDRLRHEFDAIGFYLSAHPLDSYGKSLEKLKVISYADLLRQHTSGMCKLGGIVIGKRELNSRRGSRMAFVQLSDAGGVYEVTLFSEVLSRARDLLDSARALLVTVSVEWQSDAEEPRLTAQNLEPLDEVAARAAAGLRIFLEDPAPLGSIRSLLGREEQGRGAVVLVLDLDDAQEAEFELPGRYRLSPGIRQAMKAISGVRLQDL